MRKVLSLTVGGCMCELRSSIPHHRERTKWMMYTHPLVTSICFTYPSHTHFLLPQPFSLTPLSFLSLRATLWTLIRFFGLCFLSYWGDLDGKTVQHTKGLLFSGFMTILATGKNRSLKYHRIWRTEYTGSTFICHFKSNINTGGWSWKSMVSSKRATR